MTDANGEVRLSLPSDFWFYFHGVNAKGYFEVKNPENFTPVNEGTWAVFYMKREAADNAR